MRNSGNRLIINIKASYFLVAAFVALHLGAAVLLLLVDIPSELRLVSIGAVMVSAFQTTTQYGLRRGRAAIDALRLTADGGLLLRRRHVWRHAVVLSRFVHPRLVLLRVRWSGRWLPGSVVVAADAVEPEAFRRLRASLLAGPRNPGA